VANPEVYLVRHGQTEWNAVGRFQGKLDSPLTSQGRAEAAICGRLLAPVSGSLDAVVVSPLGRAQQTSEIIVSMGTFPVP
jgi:broad specificity phosphatase PhoE